VAWALGPNYNLDIDDPRAIQAFDAIEKAKSLNAGATPIEPLMNLHPWKPRTLDAKP
jgi:hypothetical protein